MIEKNQQNRLNGGCLCGYIRFQVDGIPRRTTHCHCRHCRRSSGAAFLTWIEYHSSDFKILAGTLSQYESRSGVTRQFCGNCGTQLTYQHVDEPEIINVTACSMDNVGSVSPEDHVWCERKVPWLNLGDDLPQYKFGRFDE